MASHTTHNPSDTGPAATADPRRRWVAPLLVGALLCVAALPLVIAGYTGGAGVRAAHDQDTFHLPVIRAFAQGWPAADVTDYDSATTPGYHWALAGVARFISEDVRLLRGVAFLFSLALVVLLARAASDRTTSLHAAALCLPLCASPYVFGSSAWLLPDNAGWLGVLVVLLLAFNGGQRLPALLIAGVVLAALVAVRQSHIWAAATVWLGAWLGSAGTPGSERLLPPGGQWGRRVARTIPALLVTLPAFGVLLTFLLLWGGLVPPTFQGEFKEHQGPNPAVPAITLATIGVWGVFFAGYYLPGALRRLRARPRLSLAFLAFGVSVGALASLLPETSYAIDEGRSSGLWNAVKPGPTIAERSPIMLAMTIMGGLVCAGVGLAAPRRDAWFALGAMVAATAALTANAYAWQRYCEPLVLILLAIICSGIERPADSRLARLAFLGPLALTLVLGALTARSIT